MTKIYEEKQKIDTIWPLGLMALVSVTNYVIYFHLDQTDISFFYGSIISTAFVSSLLFIMRLQTKINEKAINYRLFPLHFKWQTILWSDVEKSEIRTFKPIREYGGWGIRNSLAYGKAYIINGDIGLQLYLKNGKKVLIGTKQEEKLQTFIMSFK